MEKNIGSRITYYEQHIRYLQNEMDEEERYRIRVGNKRKKYEDDLMQSSIIMVLLFFGLLFIGSVFAVQMGMSEDGLTFSEIWIALRKMAGQPLGTMAFFMTFFMGIGLLICIARIIRGVIRMRGMTDPKTLKFKSYQDMQTTSEQRSDLLHKELMDTIAKSEAARMILSEQPDAIQKNEDAEMKTIDIGELWEVLEEKKKG